MTGAYRKRRKQHEIKCRIKQRLICWITVYEAYDMDKLLKPVCRGDYNEKCIQCENYKKNWKAQVISCEKKLIKRKNIQRGCSKLAEISRALQLEGKSLTWDTDEDGDWAEHVKGVDDYLVDLQRAKEE